MRTVAAKSRYQTIALASIHESATNHAVSSMNRSWPSLLMMCPGT